MLTDEQTKKYYETQSGKAEPLSPLAFLSSERGEDLLYKTQKKKERLTPPEVEKPEEEIKEPEKEKTGGGMTFDDALSLYGEDFTGVHKLDDGTYEADTTAQERIGIKTDPIELQIAESKRDVATAKQDIETAQNRLRNLDISKDPSFVALSTGISNTWNDRIAEMEKANLSRVASMTQLGIRYGSKYTGGSFGSIITEEERQGIQRVSSLEAKKQQALAGAEIAFRSQKWDEYTDLVDTAEDAYDREVEELNELNEIAVKRNEAIAKENKEQREADEFEMERVENVLENITDSVFNAMTGDEEMDMQTINDIATQYDIDPNYLINSLTALQGKEEERMTDLEAVKALTKSREASAEKSLREPIPKTSKADLDKPLSASSLRTMRDDYGFSTEELPPNSTMRDAEILQAKKFIEDNRDKDEDEVKNAIAENTNLEMSFIDKIAKSVYEFFGGKKTEKTSKEKPEEDKKEMKDFTNFLKS